MPGQQVCDVRVGGGLTPAVKPQDGSPQRLLQEYRFGPERVVDRGDGDARLLGHFGDGGAEIAALTEPVVGGPNHPASGDQRTFATGGRHQPDRTVTIVKL
jgi:hypothetical protein